MFLVSLYGKMDGVERRLDAGVLVNGGRFEINQLIFADDTVLMADSEEKLCRLESEFCRVYK